MADPVVLLVNFTTSIARLSPYIIQGIFWVRNIPRDLDKLEVSLNTIQSVLREADEGQQRDEVIRKWLIQLKHAAYDAQDLLDSFSIQVCLRPKARCVPSLYKAFYQVQFSFKIQDILVKVEHIIGQQELINSIRPRPDSGGRDEPQQTQTVSHVDESAIVGRITDKEKIINMLLGSEHDTEGSITIIPITGMPGLGKTTLAQLVYNDDRVKEHFQDYRKWVVVTVNFDLSTILTEMMQPCHDKNDKNSPQNQLHSKFRDFIAGKRFLLVLDDVWTDHHQDWDSLQNLLKHGKNGSRVLVTTQTTALPRIAGMKEPHYLGFLSGDDCWSLFKMSAFPLGDFPTRLENIGREIVQRCGKLPLAIYEMGARLCRNDDEEAWQTLLKNEKPVVLPSLKCSYNDLSSELKPCFVYSCIFPKGHSFEKRELVQLWMAADLLQPQGQQRIEEVGTELFNKLLTRSFFQCSNDNDKRYNKRYVMHNLFHELAKSMSEENHHASLMCKNVEQPVLDTIAASKKLRTLVLPGACSREFGKAIDKIFHTMAYIRVLDLSSSTILEVPKSIENLKLLRYLNLSKTEIRMLPHSICNLCNLQTLKLLKCPWLFELPKDLRKLINLRHLELDEMFWYKVITLPSRMGRLTSLQNLHAFMIGRTKGYGIEELEHLACLTGTLHISKLENTRNAGKAQLNRKESLHKLVLEWSIRVIDPQDESDDGTVLEGLQPHSNLKELHICNYMSSRIPQWMGDASFTDLVSVSLKNCPKWKILSVGRLPKLQQLYIKGMEELEELQQLERGEYRFLRMLKLSCCPRLQTLPSRLPKLEEVKIKKCDSLVAFPETTTLKIVILVDNPVLEDWREGDKTFKNLWDLKIIGCPKLNGLPQRFTPKKLEIKECASVTTLPGPEYFTRLQTLALDAFSNGTLEGAIPKTSSLFSLSISNIPNLTSLPKCLHLPGLKALYIRDCQDLVCLSEEAALLQGFTSLKLLSIRCCPKFVKFPGEGLPTTLECLTINSCPNLESLGPTDTLKRLTSLKDFYIDNCPALKSFPEDGISDSLQHLVIQGCSLLMTQCRNDDGGGPDWPKIMHIPDLEICSTKVESPNSEVSSTPWYHGFMCCKGTEQRETGPSQQQLIHGLMQEGETSERKEPAETSSSGEYKGNFKGKETAESSSSA